MTNFLPILLYHRIDASLLSTSTAPMVFRRHLEWLYDRGWRTLSAQEFAYHLRTGRPFPPASFLITFDDGYTSLAHTAFDILKELDYSAIGFLSTKMLCDETQAIQASRSAHEERVFLSWEQVRALQASGVFDFHSHTHSHQRFEQRSLDDIRQDLGMSLDILVRELALPRRHFTHLAWPWGKSEQEWRTVAKDCGFDYQYTVARRAFRRDFPLDQIPRTCFDAVGLTRFQVQIELQSGHLSDMWHAAYPVGRSLRRFARLS
ncbi:MAG TPA: polysaccharide deacetylase family protein [Noviherbaspirillum sp.]